MLSNQTDEKGEDVVSFVANLRKRTPRPAPGATAASGLTNDLSAICDELDAMWDEIQIWRMAPWWALMEALYLGEPSLVPPAGAATGRDGPLTQRPRLDP